MTKLFSVVRGASAFSTLKSAKPVLKTMHWQLALLPNELNTKRFAVIVAKRLVRLAAKRNLLKRLAKVSFETRNCRVLADNHVSPGHDVLLTLIKTPTSWSRPVLRSELDNLFNQALLLDQDGSAA